MGCDIHLYREKKVNGVWVTADEGWADIYDEGCICLPYEEQFNDRDYDLFGFLATGVRHEHEFSFAARGLPFTACEEVKTVNDRCGTDGHSHSYLSVGELKEAWEFLQDKTITVSGMKDKEEIKNLRASIESEEETDWNLIYPYCKWGNSPDLEEFSIEIPANYKLGLVKTIIELFDDVDGDDHRIVFWFDN